MENRPHHTRHEAIEGAALVAMERVGFEPTVRLPVQRFSSSKILMLARATL
jgi:hypothetical protein